MAKSSNRTMKPVPPDPTMRSRRDMVVRLARVEGQLRGIQKMIEEGAACEDVAQQLSASRKALDKAFYHMLACVVEHPGTFGVLEAAEAARGRTDAGVNAAGHLRQVAALIQRFG